MLDVDQVGVGVALLGWRGGGVRGCRGRGFIDMRREEGWKEGSSSRSRVSVCRFPGADRTGERERDW